MSEPESDSHPIVDWFRALVRPIFQKTDPASSVEELDKLAKQVENQKKNRSQLFPICLLGQAGVGKSTLINTLIADTDVVVPSGGGTGPLTANALHVTYGEREAFTVRYHTKKQLNETRFILEMVERQLRRDAPTAAFSTGDEFGTAQIELDSEEQKQKRSEDALNRARLLIANSQSADRDAAYLADACRWILEQPLKFQTQFEPDDMERMGRVQSALKNQMKLGNSRKGVLKCDSAKNPQFRRLLRDHACGFLAPIIEEMRIQWPSPVLKDSLELVDLPGIGILSDAYASVTSDYLRNRAKAVMLVADARGIRREDAELLRNSGFLSRLLHASDDPNADPVALIVAVVKIDDVAVENWNNDKAVNGKALKSKSQHFADQCAHCRNDIRQRLYAFLHEVWDVDSDGKKLVIQNILDNLQVFPVSAPQYRLRFAPDDDEEVRPFLPDLESTNIPALRDAILKVARDCVQSQSQREKDSTQRFFDLVRARLEVLSARASQQRRAEEENIRFKKNLEDFIGPLQREFDTRRGGFRNFLRNTVPRQIEAKVESASNRARKGIQSDLAKLKDAHWRTLQAAVRKEGTFYGRTHINLPLDFALRFEEPLAEVWSREILVDVRRETREFADFRFASVTKVLEWSQKQGFQSSPRLLSALIEEVKQHREKANAVGKEAVDELREKVRSELISTIEGSIRQKCTEFVESRKDSGTGVRSRILEMFGQLAEEVVSAAAAPAVRLLTDRFRKVNADILTAFEDHAEPLSEAADTLSQGAGLSFALIRVESEELNQRIETARASMPVLA